jgi:NTP pyrophosphatase (non-canonical NTP hydrolase)
MHDNTLSLDAYQAAAARTAIYKRSYPERIFYPTMLLAGEAGEVSNKVSRLLRGEKARFDRPPMTEHEADEIIDEIGDVLWAAAMLAHELGYNLSEVASGNLDKLADRARRNVLDGSGDTR